MALLQRDVVLTSQDQALLAAVKANNLDSVRAAIASGADVNCRDLTFFRSCTRPASRSYYTPAILATLNGHFNIVARTGRPTDPAVLQFLLEHGADPNLNGSEGTNALSVAAGSGDMAALQLLLEHGADPNGGSPKRESALAEACYGNHLALAKQLFEHGARLDSHGEMSCTPLHRTVGLPCNPEIARWLLEQGADVNARDSSKQTPLHHAVEYADLESVELLVEHGADIHAKDGAGRTLFDVARAFPTSIIARARGEHFTEAMAQEISARMIAMLQKGTILKPQKGTHNPPN